MFYYGFNGQHAQDGIAISNNLLYWDKAPDPVLANGKPGELDEYHAHKPSVLYWNGTLYHFYCASGKYRSGEPSGSGSGEFRCITVAASKLLSNG